MDNFDKQLSQLRDEIDDIDQQLVDLLVHRRSVTAKVGLFLMHSAKHSSLINDAGKLAKRA